jgi:hypothetical protein
MERTNQRREPDALAKLGARIDEWRKRRGKPGPMPETLWRAAAKLAEKRGLNRVAARLRLDYYSLKRWVEEGRRRSAATGPAFIEVRPPGPAAAASVLELERPGGLKMTLRLSSALDVGALVEAFWRSRT